jgi:hypothetical protein
MRDGAENLGPCAEKLREDPSNSKHIVNLGVPFTHWRSRVLAEKHSTLFCFCGFAGNAPASSNTKHESSTHNASKNVAGQSWK